MSARNLLNNIAATLVFSAFVVPGISNAQVHEKLYTFIILDELEYQSGIAGPISWELTSWYGGDYNRLWVKSEGGIATSDGDGDVEVQGLFSRLITPFWELQLGLRGDLFFEADDNLSRGFIAIGLEGMAPYWIELEPSIFVSHEGDVSARVAGTYDMLITQRAILQPSLEINFALQEVEKFGVGSGINDIELGLRLRYELRREIAPYLGIQWERAVRSTADIRRAAGVGVEEVRLLAGLRLWR